MSKSCRIRVLPALLLLLVSGAALAQQDAQYEAAKGMDERFRLDVGGFFQTFDTTISVGPKSGGIGSNINLERDFDLGNQTTFRADGWYRFGRHASLQFGYRGWSRSITKTLEREINFGDRTFEVGAEVDFRQRVRVVDLYYGYSFINTGKFETGLMLGVSGMFNRVSLEASVTGPGEGGAATRQQSNLTIPIPSAGAFVAATILPRLFVEASVRGFPKITVSNYTGSDLDVRAGATYFFTKNVGLGVKYQYVKFTFSRNVAARVELDYRYNGPMAYVAAAF